MAQDSVKIDRYKYIGGSDVAAIMNLSPFKTRWQLLQEKAQIIEDTFEGSKYTEYGNTMEPKIRDYINDTLGHGFIEGRHYNEERGFRIHTDGEDEVTETVLEIKTTSHIYKNIDDYKYYLVQVLFYMAVLGYDNAILAVYERPEDFNEDFDPERLNLYPIFYNDYLPLVKEIENEVTRFQNDVERLKNDPFLKEEDFIPTDLVALSNDILTLESTLAHMKEVESQLKTMKVKLYEAMSENGIKTWASDYYRLTRVDGTPARMETVEELDEKSLRQDLPELFKPVYDGGYVVEKQVKKPARSGYVKITKLKEGNE